ncbi:MAG: hypothetical protein HY907_06320 [Deltaproteobacteria bacterium]|nr:hypothetical protein [Deltaproteobacteria bacterium]
MGRGVVGMGTLARLTLVAAMVGACSKGGGRGAGPGEAGVRVSDDAVGRMVGRLRDPATRESGLGELEGLLAQIGSSSDPGIRHDSYGSLAARVTPVLIEAFGDERTGAAARARMVAALGIVEPHDGDATRRGAVLDRVFVSTLAERFPERATVSEAHAALLGLLALLAPAEAGGGPAISGPALVRGAEALRAAVGGLLRRGGTLGEAGPSPGATVPPVTGEDLLLACVHGTETLLAAPGGLAAEPAGIETVAAVLRDSSPSVPVSARLAAAEALGRLLQRVGDAAARATAEALVTGFFVPAGDAGDAGALRLAIRRAMVGASSRGGGWRDAVIRELLRVLAAVADPALLERTEEWKALGPNRDVASVASPGEILRRAAGALADVLPRAWGGADVPGGSSAELAVQVLRSEIVQAAGAITRGGEALAGDGGAATIAWALAAAETLALVGAAGPDGQNVDLLASLVRAAATNLEALPAPLGATGSGAGVPGAAGRAVFGGLLESLVRLGRPTPQALAVLADLAGRPSLAGVREDAIFPPSRAQGVDGDAAFVRGRAARAFGSLYRRDPAGAAEADAVAEALRLRLERVEPLLALEQTDAGRAPFALWPPPFAAGEAPAPGAIDFADYADALAACVLPERENPGHAAAWQAMSEADRERYCRARVEPFGREPAAPAEGFVPEPMELADGRCWEVMRRAYQREAQFCSAQEARRVPELELSLTGPQCRQVMLRESALGACFNLPRHPGRAERGQPTLWACYERFPWLREREPVGPWCGGLAARLLAARLFVRLREQAGTPAADGATPARLEAILPFAELLARLAAPGAAEDDAFVAALERTTAVLAEVQLDVPVFRPPQSPIERVVLNVPAGAAGEGAEDVEELIAVPWYARPGFVERRATTFAALRADFRAACGAAADDAEGGCAAGGGELDEELRAHGGGAGGGSLAAVLVEEDLPGLLLAWAAADAIDARCLAEGVYGVECLRGVVAEGAAAIGERERALRLLLALGAAEDEATVREVLLELAAAPPEPSLEPLVGFGLRRLAVECPSCPGTAGCEASRCGAVRFGD